MPIGRLELPCKLSEIVFTYGPLKPQRGSEHYPKGIPYIVILRENLNKPAKPWNTPYPEPKILNPKPKTQNPSPKP